MEIQFKSQAERDYAEAYRNMALAYRQLDHAKTALLESRGVRLPYAGAMKNRYNHATKRMNEIADAMRGR